MELSESNNPGNLREVGIKWQGKTGEVRGFTKFSSLEMGFRAMVMNANRKIINGHNTLSSLITIWAPPSENDTKSYIASVAKETGLTPTTKITQSSQPLIRVCLAMVTIEHGPAARTKVYNAVKHLTITQLLD